LPQVVNFIVFYYLIKDSLITYSTTSEEIDLKKNIFIIPDYDFNYYDEEEFKFSNMITPNNEASDFKDDNPNNKCDKKNWVEDDELYFEEYYKNTRKASENKSIKETGNCNSLKKKNLNSYFRHSSAEQFLEED